MARIRDLALTYRLYFLPVVYVTVVFGFITGGKGITLTDYVLFFLIALSAHIFGFGVNDWSDLPYDKHNPRHWRRSLLVRGELSLTWHQFITLIQFPVLVAWAFILKAPFISVVIVAISIILLTIYNLLGKKSGKWVVLTDLCFPLSLVFLFLSGYSLVRPLSDLTPQVILLMSSLFLSLFIGNSVQGGFRDLASDYDKGASNFLIMTGSRIEAGKLRTSPLSRNLAGGVIIANLPIILFMEYLNESVWWHYPLIAFLLFCGFMDLFVLLRLDNTDRLKTTDYYVAMAYIFYAAMVPWMHYLPGFLWAVIVINVLYPFVINNKTHFGRQTWRRFIEDLRPKT